jgi:hypothetical protein
MNRLSGRRVKIFTLLITLLAVFSNSGTTQTSAPCEEFRKLLSIRGGLSPYKLEVPPDPDGNMRISNIDVDGDGVVDDVLWSCPGSGSVIPADPCTLSIKLSSGKKIEFQESRFYLVQYAAKLYVMAADYTSVNQKKPNPADVKTKVYRVTQSGVELACPKM